MAFVFDALKHKDSLNDLKKKDFKHKNKILNFFRQYINIKILTYF